MKKKIEIETQYAEEDRGMRQIEEFQIGWSGRIWTKSVKNKESAKVFRGEREIKNVGEKVDKINC